jgi:hypothetical protein
VKYTGKYHIGGQILTRACKFLNKVFCFNQGLGYTGLTIIKLLGQQYIRKILTDWCLMAS